MNKPANHQLEAAPTQRRGILFVLSAPSGAGKSTLCNALRQTPDFSYSVSCTTRAPRPGEIAGRDYHFLTREEFEKRIANGEFLEHAKVHENYYGTLRANILAQLANGEDVLLDIDVQGADMIRRDPHKIIRAAHADIFLMPASIALLEQRLRKRGTETEDQIALRLHNARAEMRAWRDYRYTIITGTPEEDFQNFRAIILAERNRSNRRFTSSSLLDGRQPSSWMSQMNSIIDTIRQHVVGQRLSGVTFVMNYVQLQFDPPPTINALTPITVRSGNRVAVSGDESFRNLLCEQIPKTITSISLVEKESLNFCFEDNSTISLSLRPEDYVGPEAVNVYGRDHLCLIF